MRVLVESGDTTALWQWLDGSDEPAHDVEAECEVEAELVRRMPAQMWTPRAPDRLGDARPRQVLRAIDEVASSGRTDLAAGVRAILLGLSDPDLFRAVALTLVAAREPVFGSLVLGIVEEVPIALLDPYTDAVAVSRSNHVGEVVSRISARARAGV